MANDPGFAYANLFQTVRQSQPPKRSVQEPQSFVGLTKVDINDFLDKPKRIRSSSMDFHLRLFWCQINRSLNGT
jgi:hypothetical protein